MGWMWNALKSWQPLDSHTSELCQSLDGHVEEMKNYEAGVTAPPIPSLVQNHYCSPTLKITLGNEQQEVQMAKPTMCLHEI